MNKKVLILGVIVIAIIAGVVASLSASTSETVNLDMGRTHGTISTAMGSPILGDPSAPITIVEFGDYQCHQCFNWFHNTKPELTRDYIETGKVNLVFVDLAFLGSDSPKAA
ncbi:MAG: thioredoxin domain-containing protein, partial [Nitrosopumilus sp.]|nr:thioredoxin domain-containing protein [Nitrosopumilus sp.]